MKTLFLLLFLFLLILCLDPAGAQNLNLPSFFQSYVKPKTAPDFSLYDLHGNLVRSNDFRNKVVLLNFWSTWCPNCRQEASLLEELQAHYKDKELLILRINAKESRETLQKFIEKNPSKLTILLDEKDKVGRLMGVWVHPTTYLIDRQGKIRYRAMGVVNWLSPEVREIIDQLLKESKE